MPGLPSLRRALALLRDCQGSGDPEQLAEALYAFWEGYAWRVSWPPATRARADEARALTLGRGPGSEGETTEALAEALQRLIGDVEDASERA